MKKERVLVGIKCLQVIIDVLAMKSLGGGITFYSSRLSRRGSA